MVIELIEVEDNESHNQLAARVEVLESKVDD